MYDILADLDFVLTLFFVLILYTGYMSCLWHSTAEYFFVMFLSVVVCLGICLLILQSVLLTPSSIPSARKPETSRISWSFQPRRSNTDLRRL